MFQFIWDYLTTNCNQWDILYCTIIVLLISELPIILFTILDLPPVNSNELILLLLLLLFSPI